MKIIKESSQPAPKKNLVRLSKITVDPAQLERYNAFLEEEIEASMRLEPGVLTLYAVSEKEHPNKVTILEIYADQDAYKSHIQTPHFQKYKQGTLQMVQELELVDSTPLIPGLKDKNKNKNPRFPARSHLSGEFHISVKNLNDLLFDHLIFGFNLCHSEIAGSTPIAITSSRKAQKVLVALLQGSLFFRCTVHLFQRYAVFRN